MFFRSKTPARIGYVDSDITEIAGELGDDRTSGTDKFDTNNPGSTYL